MTRFAFFLALLLSLAACDSLTFEPKGQPPETLVDPEGPPLEIDLTVATDTLDLRGIVLLRIDVGDARPIQRFEVFLGEQVIAEIEGDDLVPSLTIDTEVVSDGTYDLEVRAYAQSETGSLADRFGQEEVVAQETRVGVVDNAPLASVPILSAAPQNGQLEIRWARYTRRIFQAYRVVEVEQNGTRRVHAQFSDPSVTTWSDPDYFGETTQYLIEVRAANEWRSGTPELVSYPEPDFIEVVPEGDGVRLTWSSTPFTDPFRSYILLRAEASASGEGEEIARFENPTDTTFLDSRGAAFGARFTYRLRTANRSFSTVYTSPSVTVAQDLTVPGFNVAGFSPAARAFVGLSEDGGTLVYVDPKDFNSYVNQALPAPAQSVLVSQDGGLALVARTGGSASLIDLARGLGVLNTYEQRSILGASEYPNNGADESVLTNDGLHVASYVAFYSPAVYGGLGISVINARTGGLVGRLDAEGVRPPNRPINYNSTFLVEASPEGGYAVVRKRLKTNNALYEIESNGTFRKLVDLPGGGIASTAIAFLSDDRVAVMQRGSGRIRILSLPSLSVITEFGTAGIRTLDYDAGSGLLYGSLFSADGRNATMWGYSPDTGEEVFRAATVSDPQVRLYGGALWSGSAYRRVAPLL